jgi:hypothetical protein
MSEHSIIKTVSGSVNLRKQSAKTCFFHAPRKGGKGNREVFLDKAATNGVTGGPDGVIHRAGAPSYSDSVPGVNGQIGGRRVEQQFSIAEGEIIKGFVNVRPSYGKLPKSASVFLRVRKDAAYRRLKFKMLDHADTTLTHSTIEGCFDILTTAEAVAAGCHIPTAYRSFSDPSNLATVLEEDIIIHPEKAAAPRYEERIVKDGQGNERKVVKRKRRRMIGD